MTSFDQLLQFYMSYIRPVIDVCLLAFILYKVYGVIQKTHGAQLLKGAIIVLLLYAVALSLKLSTLLWLLNTLAPGLLIGVAIVFQPELRKIVLKLGQTGLFRFSDKPEKKVIEWVLTAAEQLSAMRRGMLVVFIRHTDFKDIAETGTSLNADLSSSLLVTIFAHDTPLHDAAVLVKGNKIMAAGCFLPLSDRYDIKKTFGTRHRAALGISEVTDAVVLVVSEETGAISLAYDSKLYYDLSQKQLVRTLKEQLGLKDETVGEEGGSNDTKQVD